jgi:hypothetical protein
MGNMQFTLDKTFDSIPVKDASSAKDIIAAIKKTEDKVSKIFWCNFENSTKMNLRKCTKIFKKICWREWEEQSQWQGKSSTGTSQLTLLNDFKYLNLKLICYFMCSSAVKLLFIHWLVEIWINVFWENSVLEGVVLEVVLRKWIHLDLALFSLEEVVEGSMLSARLALVPILGLFVAHSSRHFLSLDAVRHPLHEGVAGMRLHVHGIKWLHN